MYRALRPVLFSLRSFVCPADLIVKSYAIPRMI